MLRFYLFVLIYFMISKSEVQSLCPNPESIPECECFETNFESHIQCKGEFIKTLSLNISNSNFIFNELLIQSTELKTIDDNSLGNAIFDEIYIENNEQLRTLSANVFDKSKPKRLYIRNNKQLTGVSLFPMIKNLMNINFIDLSRNAITEIPSFAFKPNNSSLISKLREIKLNVNNITTIASNSFNGLKELTLVSLTFNQINKVDENGLTLDSELMNHEITIDLSNNKLIDQSFSAKSFENKQKNNIKIVLHLNNNSLTKLDQNIFIHFFDNRRNYLELMHNKFVCDCDMKWIQNLSVSKNIISHTIDCDNFQNKSLFILTDSQLNCPPMSSTTPRPGHRCPLAQDIKHCFCDAFSSAISCINNNITDIELQTIGSKLKGLKFHSIDIRETNITSIDKNYFIDVSFETVVISSNKYLSKIDSQSFHIPEEVIKDQRHSVLNINKNSELDDLSVYQLAVKLNAFSIDFSENSLKEIPSEAFKSSDNSSHYNNKLESINLSHNKIVSIGSNAFKGLLKLDYLNLAYNHINKLNLNNFGITSSQIHRNLIIELNYNQISSQSLSNESILKRDNISLTIYFGNNRFTNLSENTLKNLIESKDNKLYFNNNKFICDCSMIWLIHSNITNKNFHILCSNNEYKSILDMKEEQLRCPPLILTTDTTTIQSTTETTTHKMFNNCPASQSLKPCICDQNRLTIDCESIIDSDLIRIGSKLSGSYHKLSIIDSKITAIDKNTFPNVSFDSIVIEYNPHLQTIDSNAFKHQSIKNLSISYNKIFDDLNIFDLFENLSPNEIYFIANAIKRIPAKSFAKNSTKNSRLKILNFDYNKIEKIESNSFEGLISLMNLSINHNLISVIEENGLKFETNYEHSSVKLNYNKLNSSSFSSKSIQIQQNVSLSLYLENNELTSINETVFKPLIENNVNEIYLTENKFICDCNMKWILENVYKNNIHNVFCNNKLMNILKLDIKDLKCGSL